MNKKLELYNKAMEAYYSGEEIMDDPSFDKLEKSLGLDNKVLGSSHSNNYTIQHPYIMGSLNKVHWDDYLHVKDILIEIYKYIHKYNDNNKIIITPKYDGCSFEINYVNGIMKSACTRGDGYYGRDITNLMEYLLSCKKIKPIMDTHANCCIRGELLIDKRVFSKKYKDEFKNPRSFVSGLVNSDWSDSLKPRIEDLSLVVYDTRFNKNKPSKKPWWNEVDWDKAYIPKPDFVPKFYMVVDLDSDVTLSTIYQRFYGYRLVCPYSIDGIVIKPVCQYRKNNPHEEYPSDCVAIKFPPQTDQTTVTNIEWKIGKTGEYIPTVCFKPIKLDGKEITRATGSNYGNIISKNISIGSRITVSLAGDIIPYIYAVNKVPDKLDYNLPSDYTIEGIHLMAKLGDDKLRYKFIHSALSLKVPNIGESTVVKIWENIYWRNDKKKLNILCIKPHTIYKALGRSKYAKNVKYGFNQVLSNLTLSEIIQSCNFSNCGIKASDNISKYLMGQKVNINNKACAWVNNKDSQEFKELLTVLSYLKKDISDFKPSVYIAKIPVILTGKPNNWSSKGEFLSSNPQYVETTSWSEVKIVFTNSIDSTSSKMKKAVERGVQIELYLRISKMYYL